jgi:hypothetical protein
MTSFCILQETVALEVMTSLVAAAGHHPLLSTVQQQLQGLW